jgi:hypothetical protein
MCFVIIPCSQDELPNIDTPRLTQYLRSGRSGDSHILFKSELSVPEVNYVCISKGVCLKSQVRHTGTRPVAAWPPRRMCYRPAVVFRHLTLTAISFPHNKTILFIYFFFFFFKLSNSESACNLLQVYVYPIYRQTCRMRGYVIKYSYVIHSEVT